MSAMGPSGFYVQVGPSGTLLLRGDLDLNTVQDLQDKIDKIRRATELARSPPLASFAPDSPQPVLSLSQTRR